MKADDWNIVRQSPPKADPAPTRPPGRNNADEASDADLLVAAGQGDREAFGLLVERLQQPLFHFIFRYLGAPDRDTVEDLAQDVFLKAWKSCPSFRPRAQVRTWLFQIATHACLNYRRGQRLRRMLSLSVHPSSENRLASDERATPGGGEADPDSTLYAMIASLPDNQRAALILRHFHDFSYAEIAGSLQVSVAAVESLLFRARSELREKLSGSSGRSTQVPGKIGAPE